MYISPVPISWVLRFPPVPRFNIGRLEVEKPKGGTTEQLDRIAGHLELKVAAWLEPTIWPRIDMLRGALCKNLVRWIA